MANMYEGLSEEERLERICKILVRWIYRATTEEERNTANNDTETTYNLTQAAHKLGVSKRTLQRWITQRRFQPKIKKDRTYLITSKELRDLRSLRSGV